MQYYEDEENPVRSQASPYEAQDMWDEDDGSCKPCSQAPVGGCSNMEPEVDGSNEMRFGPAKIMPFLGTHHLFEGTDDEHYVEECKQEAGTSMRIGDGSPVYRNQQQAPWYDDYMDKMAEAAAAAAQRPDAWLEFCGTVPETGLPLRIELEGPCPIAVGRVTHGLDSTKQPNMVSREHLLLTYNPLERKWALENKSKPNGTLLQRAGATQSKRVQCEEVKDGDIIFFGGAGGTPDGETPANTKAKSIYVYRFRANPAPGSGVGAASAAW